MSFYRKKGFTLLELMIVVIIVGILASLAVPRFIDATRKAKEAEAKAMLGAIRSAQLRYYLENNWTFYQGSITAGSPVDLSITSSKYYDYIGANDDKGTSELGQAQAIVGTGLHTFSIDEDGDITQGALQP